ncbi:MAG: hypothetical protein HQK83_00975 [Fibrobacteria bacterium]|nr:hypothetical protein [Fibrobacteria bacterium]
MHKVHIMFLLMLFTTINTLYSQECGPSCPVCSGTGESGGTLLSPKSLLISGIAIPTSDEDKGVVNLRYGVTKWLDIGAGYTINTKKPLWSLRVSPLSENEDGWRPGVILGTGSVQTGGNDQSVFAQLTKSWEFSEGFAMRVSGGVASLIPDFNKIYGVAGLTLTVTERVSPFVSFDGKNLHFGLAWIPVDWMTIGGLLVESKYAAVSLGFRWSFAKPEAESPGTI